jgi:phenylalanyl-tRNA synthetase beta chain
MQRLAGGRIASGLVDVYPRPAVDSTVALSAEDVERALGIRLTLEEVADILRRLEFVVEKDGAQLHVKAPPYRLDIGHGLIGVADLVEEIARVYGYDRIPETLLADTLPPQRGDRLQEMEEDLRDQLAGLGLQEVITYRLTTSERDGRTGEVESGAPYVRLANPIASDRVVLRRSLLTSVLEIVESNRRLRESIAVFEIGPVFLMAPGASLPEETRQMVLALTGRRRTRGWQPDDDGLFDFYDLKGIVLQALQAMHLDSLQLRPAEHPAFHPGKCAEVLAGDRRLGILGEIHPHVRSRFELGDSPVAAAELDLQSVLEAAPERVAIVPVPTFPPVLEDLAFIVEEGVPAGEVEAQLRAAGGPLLSQVRLFDVFRGEQIGEGRKSLAYSLVYQAGDRTLTDEEIADLRGAIVARLENALGAKLRG